MSVLEPSGSAAFGKQPISESLVCPQAAVRDGGVPRKVLQLHEGWGGGASVGDGVQAQASRGAGDQNPCATGESSLATCWCQCDHVWVQGSTPADLLLVSFIICASFSSFVWRTCDPFFFWCAIAQDCFNCSVGWKTTTICKPIQDHSKTI